MTKVRITVTIPLADIIEIARKQVNPLGLKPDDKMTVEVMVPGDGEQTIVDNNGQVDVIFSK